MAFKSGFGSTFTWNSVLLEAEDVQLPEDPASTTTILSLTGVDVDYDGPTGYGMVQATIPEAGAVSYQDGTSHTGVVVCTRIPKTCTFVGFCTSDKFADLKRGQAMKRVLKIVLTQAPVWS